jgi:ketosteroid isomerase-like protein
MDTRATIEAMLDQLYAARRANDADAAGTLFAADGRFAANLDGMPTLSAHVERVSAMNTLFTAFKVVDFHEHCRVIDPPRAVVHWRGRFRALNGREGEASILDLFEFQDGKVAAATTFYDTAYAARLSGPG